MTTEGTLPGPTLSHDSVVVLFKSGRLPSWYGLSEAERTSYERQHVELMQDISRRHGLRRLEGFRLIGPQEPWARFWLIEFPTFEGAEAWMRAEIEPPYGPYGHYEYHLARPWGREYFASWVPAGTAPAAAGAADYPSVSRDSVVVLSFSRVQPASEALTPDERGDPEHVARMRETARQCHLRRFEAFQLLGVQPHWHRAWVAEFDAFEEAEAWIEAEVEPPYAMHGRKAMYLARRWGADYFPSWIPSPA